MKLEIVVFDRKMAIDAEKSGATQLNILMEPNQGGLSVCAKTVEEIVQAVSIPVYVNVRLMPTHYFEDKYMEYAISYIEEVKSYGVTGVIFGSLTPEDKINEKHLKAVLAASEGIEFVYNRAVDFTKNYKTTIKLLKKYGVKSIISSGGTDKAVKGIDNLIYAKDYIEDIIIGASVGLDNVEELYKATGIKQFHIGSDVWINEDKVDKKRTKQIRKLLEEI